MNIKEKIAYELHKPARKNFIRRPFKVININETIQIDLIDMKKFSNINRGNKYILTLIDIFSKKAYALPLKDKSGLVVAKAMASILPQIKGIKNIQSDNGKEFFNKHFKALMKQYNINHYFSFSTNKAAIAERFQRTLKNWLFREFSSQGSYKWLDILPQLMQKYNNKVHRSIKMAPNKVTIKNSQQVHKNLLMSVSANRLRKNKSKFKVGDTVRISKYKHIFSKSYYPNWTTELFTVVKVNKTKPKTYILKDENQNIIQGSFYNEELLKTKYKDLFLIEKVLKKKKDKYYVKYLGFPSSQNGWIPAKNLIV